MSHGLQVILLVMLVIAAAKLAGALATRMHQPSVFGEILAGVLLGPSLLDVLGWPVFADGNAHAMLALVQDLSQIGVLLLMFVAGLETDLPQLRRVGHVAFWAALGGVLLPLAGGAATAVAFGLPLYWSGIFIGTILTATSVSISAQTLLELGALRTREGSTILGAAVIDDVMGIIVLSIVAALATVSRGSDAGWTTIGVLGLRIALFFALAIGGTRLLTPLLRWASRLGVSQATLAAALVIMFGYAWLAEYLGAIAAITGAYVSGVLLAQTPFKRDIDAGIHPLTYTLFVPAFFIGIGLQANARELGAHAAFTAVLIAVAIIAKALGCGLFAKLSGFSGRESLRVGVGMISRGEVGLIVAGYGLAAGLIDRDVFSASVLMVLATTMVTPPLLRLVFPSRRPEHAVYEETIAHVPDAEPAID
ncbi:MAG TPA: cation:proton antiporter [Vicinamibacterales bacterium]|jgi:Kef-type K+ transport system membrane component KefB|nr:cation:proton antiporter [Vicinamibacterales bacterium]